MAIEYRKDLFENVVSESTSTEFSPISDTNLLLNNLLNTNTNKDLAPSQKTSETIRVLVDVIEQLYTERKKAHESLEVLTIETSKKRCLLQTLPNIYNEHMKDAVLSARSKIEKEIKDVETTLQININESNQAEVSFQHLRDENKKLKPESEKSQEKYNELILALNHRLDEKTRNQIYLNETEQTTKDIKKENLELDIGFENLKEDLYNYVEDSTKKKKDVLEKTKKIQQVLDEQLKVNKKLKKIDDEFENQIFEANIDLKKQMKKSNKIENVVRYLDNETRRIEIEIAKKIPGNEKLRHERDYIEGSFERQKIEYAEKIQSMNTLIKEASEKIQRQKSHLKISKENQNENKKQESEIEIQKNDFDIVLQNQIKISDEIRSKKDEYEEVLSKFQLENNELKHNLEQGKLKHESFVKMTKQRISDFTEDLKNEKNNRKESLLQQKQSERSLKKLQSEIDNFIQNHFKEIEQTKNQHQFGSEKMLRLTRETRLNLRKTGDLKTEFDLLKKKFQRKQNEWLMQTQRLSTDVDSLKMENERNEIKKEKMLKSFNELAKTLETETTVYEKAKLGLIKIRNKEQNLNKEKQRLEEKMIAITDEIKESKVKIKQNQSLVCEQLNSMNTERQVVEVKLLDFISLTETIEQQNYKIVEKLNIFSNNINLLNEKIKKYGNYRFKSLVNQIESIRTEILELSVVFSQMESKSSREEYKKVIKMQNLAKDLQTRSKETTKILTTIKYMVEDFEGFLHSIQLRRPKNVNQQISVEVPTDKRSDANESLFITDAKIQSSSKPIKCTS